jgi:hypothetical protein
MSREPPHGHITQVNGHLIVEPGRAAATEIGALYRELAVLCIEKRIRGVLVKPSDDDAAADHALRVAMTTMVLAGLPAEFKIALVADSGRIEARYRDTERDLCLAGIDAKMFETEYSAARWLAGP